MKDSSAPQTIAITAESIKATIVRQLATKKEKGQQLVPGRSFAQPRRRQRSLRHCPLGIHAINEYRASYFPFFPSRRPKCRCIDVCLRSTKTALPGPKLPIKVVIKFNDSKGITDHRSGIECRRHPGPPANFFYGSVKSLRHCTRCWTDRAHL